MSLCYIIFQAHSELEAPWSYLVALKDYKLRAHWYRNEAEISIQLQKRIKRTKSGQSALKRFDAPTMLEYQVPPKPFETNYCRQCNVPAECADTFDGCKFNVPRDDLVVHKSSVGENAGRGLFTTRDIPSDACLIAEDNPTSIQMLPTTWSVIEAMHEGLIDDNTFTDAHQGLAALTTFILGYGYGSHVLVRKHDVRNLQKSYDRSFNRFCSHHIQGTAHWSVDSNIVFFMNHGCNQTYNYGDAYSPTTEVSADLNFIPTEYDATAEVYSPVIERHLRAYRSGPDHTLRDIMAREELLANYLAFFADEDEWEKDVLEMRGQCAGDTLGEISEYEHE